MNPAVKSVASRYGFIIGGISVGYSLIAYLVNLKWFTVWWMGILLFAVSIVLHCVAVGKARSLMGGFISFKDAFTTFFVSGLIASFISSLFMILLFNVIDTEAAEVVNELTIQASVEMMENFGTPEEAIDQQIKSMEENSKFSVKGLTWGFLGSLLFYAVLGLIVAAFMKKNKPEGFPEEVA